MFSRIGKKAGIACLAALLLSLTVFLIALFACPRVWDKILLIVASLLLLGVAGLVFYYDSLEEKPTQMPNFFLYDEVSGKNFALEQLTFQRVNHKLTAYIAENFASQRVLWIGNGLSVTSRFGDRAVYRTLVVYKMLYDVIAHDIPKLWRIFWHVPPTTINAICVCLNQNDDAPVAKRLRMYVEAGEESLGELRKYFLSNSEYIKEQMLDYVKKNIDMFY